MATERVDGKRCTVRMIQLKVSTGNNGCVEDPWGPEQCSSERRGGRKKSTKHSRVGREHPQVHWRVSMQGAAYTHACILYTIPQRVMEAESSHTHGGRAGSGLPQTSPSCSGRPPAWWFRSCWSPGPCHPSPSPPGCCEPGQKQDVTRDVFKFYNKKSLITNPPAFWGYGVVI